MNQNLPPLVVRRIEELIDASYAGRDELYAAADALDDQQRRNVCLGLAEHLANHAVELQQLLVANGVGSLEPLDMYSVAEAYFSVVKARDGDAGVLSVAEKCEQTVKERFDAVIDGTNLDDTRSMLERQRKDVEFGQDVLRSIQPPAPADPKSDSEKTDSE